MYNRLAVYGFCFTLVACTNTPDSKSSQFSPPEGATVEESVQIEIRDGARLNTLVMLPEEAQHHPVPAILIRTPYKSELNSRSGLNLKLLEQGYALINARLNPVKIFWSSPLSLWSKI
jgi:predicted acyl esterase